MRDRLKQLQRHVCTILLLLLLSPLPELRAEGEKIADVIIVGNRRVERSTIMSVLKQKAGEPYFAEKVDSDIRAIHRLGHFRDVRAELSTNDRGDRVLTYRVTEKPVVRDITFEGVREISQEKVSEAFGLKKNSIHSTKAVTIGVEKIRKLYADEGFYLAEVKVETEPFLSGDMKLKVLVSEGEKVLIRSIRFEGNRSFADDVFIGNRLLFRGGIMETKESWFFSWLTGAGTYKEEQLKNDILLITDHYFNNGFINVKVAEPVVTLSPDKRHLDILIRISEGERFSFGDVSYRGETADARKELGEKLKIRPGETFNRSLLRMDVVALTDWFADRGYAFANIVPQTRVDPERKIVDISYDVEKGEKVTIDTIAIRGNSKTRDKVIRRELKLAEGELYSATGIRRSKQALMNLGYFEDATIATARGSSENLMNLNVEVKEKPTGTFSIGAGYSSIDKFVGQGSVQQANFMGLGLKLNASASIGGTSTTYSLGLTDPYFMDTRWTLGGDVYRVEREYVNSYTRRVVGGNVKGGYPLTDEISLFMLYKYEEKQILKKAQQFVEAVRLGQITDENSSTVSAVNFRLSRNTTDYRLDPTKGMTNNLSVEFAGLGGDTRYLRTVADSALFIPAFWSTVFMTRATVGTVQKVGKDIAIDEKFYLGGINTVRGYASRTLSPYVTSQGETYDLYGAGPTSYFSRLYTGGDTEFYANVELQIPLLKDAGLKGVLFYDMGNANDGFGNLFKDLRASYGFGFRWFSPIGPLRLEYGIPLDPRAGIDDRGGRFEFSIGTFF